MSAAALPVVRGTVLDADGRAVAGAVLAWRRAPAPVADVAQLTGADGSFALAAPVPGRYRLACRSDAHGSVEADVDVGAASPAPLTLRLPR